MSGKIILASAVLTGGMLITSCGGTDVSSSPSGATSIAGYITDVPADSLTVFEVTLYEIRLSNGTATVAIFSDNNGVAVDLTDLKGVMKYMGSVNIAGSTIFTSIEIVVGKNVNIKDANGNTAIVSFGASLPGVTCDQTTDKCTIKVENLNIDVSKGKVAIDFDLKGFQINVNNGNITSISIKHRGMNNDAPIPYELTGVVKSVDFNNNSFVITWGEKNFTVRVDQNTVCEGMGPGCLPQTNWCVEVESGSDPVSSSTILALEVERKKAKKCIAKNSNPEDFDEDNVYSEKKYKLAGIDNISIDVQNSTITIDGTVYHIGADSVCKVEMEEVTSMAMDNHGNNDNNQSGEGDEHQALQKRYKKGADCITAVNQVVTSLQNAQNTPNVEVEVKVSNDQSKLQNHIIKIEIKVGDDDD